MRLAYASLVLVTCLVLSTAGGCSGDEFIDFPSTGTTGSGGATGGGGSGSSTGGKGGSGATTSGTAGNGGGGASGTQCNVPADCDAKLGPSPCGAWACTANVCEASSPGCTDADHDGYGAGAACACAGLDCDDADAAVHDTATASCYSGPAGTAGVGTCQAGSRSCAGGVWTPCVGEITPSGEACNGQDDDCNGQVDDGLGSFTCGLGACQKSVPACVNGVVQACTPGVAAVVVDGPQCNGIDDDCDGAVDEDCKSCVPVALPPLGNDITGNGTFALPFATIQAAIDWAATHVGPKTVCVAAGPACGTPNGPVTGTYVNASNTTVTMANGVSVLGNYESTQWNRCNASTTTVIQPKTGAGVTFPAAVNTPTVLDGFRVDRHNSNATAGITVDGGTKVVIANISITNTPSVMTSYGVNVINNGDALVTSRCHIDAGAGSVESIGVRAVGAKVALQNNCLSLDAQGRCDDFCGNNPSIRGRLQPGPGATYAVLLSNAKGSSVESSALCSNQADTGAIVRIDGDATGVLVRGNFINAFGGVQDSHGVWMEDCNDAAPWIVDNFYIAAAGVNQQSRVDGVRAVGACHPVVDTNLHIAGGGEGQAANPNGVHCAANAAKTPSQCVVLGNKLIRGSDFGFPPIATGVRCDDGSCLRVAGNVITGRGGGTSYGVYLQATGTVVDANQIGGGCSKTAVGVRSDDAYSRIQNNLVTGFTPLDCAAGGQPPQIAESWALQAFLSPSVNALDVHSNDLDGGGLAVQQCTSGALDLDVGLAPPGGGSGAYRNNILRAGVCAAFRYGVLENDPGADPAVFEHNDLDPTGAPTALYVDEGTTLLATPGAVDALADMTVNGTISVDPLYVNYPTDLHLAPGSQCIAKGTPNGAPATDFEGDPRDPATPDIGADER